jgi:hypothetical protein
MMYRLVTPSPCHPVTPSSLPPSAKIERLAMNDFTRVVLAFGRGIVKILISALVGFGIGLLIVGITTAGKPQIWRQPDPPGELFIGIGAGLLSGGGTLLALFFLPWFLKRQAEPSFLDESPVVARVAPRPMRYEDDAPPVRRAPKPPHTAADDSQAPMVRPAPPPPPRAEPGDAGFYEK